MITASDFKDWLKERVDCPTWFTGGLRDTKEKSIVIYNGKAYTNPMAIGGVQNSSYTSKGIRILIHWNKNIKESELKAQEVYNSLLGQSGVIAGKRVIQFKMRDSEPVYLGVDSSGIYEYVIDLEIIIER
ncbi:minor capsid protein [Tissierella sp. MSJ-40]|uniref:Minor capsid protein n=1 Tax=Tissierella simiarum TaxID=2841534 RepID=A0ABS6E9P3_9FIRM|nr:minor capsid protein [Tissierella simiarum]MBU5439497.1 minor capsid protein [Tissierella simiarum]